MLTACEVESGLFSVYSCTSGSVRVLLASGCRPRLRATDLLDELLGWGRVLGEGCLPLHGVEIRWTQQVPLHPSTDLCTWAKEFRKDCRSGGTVATTNFGTLGHLINGKRSPKADAALQRLCLSVKATPDQQELLFAAYKFLAKTIRNRDAHAYVPNVRDYHFSLVPDLFAGCFNLLASWLPGGPRTLTNWRDEARQFIAAL